MKIFGFNIYKRNDELEQEAKEVARLSKRVTTTLKEITTVFSHYEFSDETFKAKLDSISDIEGLSRDFISLTTRSSTGLNKDTEMALLYEFKQMLTEIRALLAKSIGIILTDLTQLENDTSNDESDISMVDNMRLILSNIAIATRDNGKNKDDLLGYAGMIEFIRRSDFDDIDEIPNRRRSYFDVCKKLKKWVALITAGLHSITTSSNFTTLNYIDTLYRNELVEETVDIAIGISVKKEALDEFTKAKNNFSETIKKRKCY